MGDNISSLLEPSETETMTPHPASRLPWPDTLMIDGAPFDDPRELSEFLWQYYHEDQSSDRGLILDGAILVTQVAVDLQQDSSDRAQLLFDLGARLDARVDLKGDLEDLSRAISALRRAVELTLDNDPNQIERLNLLGLTLMRRFKHLGKLEDFNSAISAFGRAVDLAPDDDASKPAILGNYGASLRARFERTKDPRDIEHSIAVLNCVVEITSNGNCSNPMHFSSLGNSLLARYSFNGQLADLEQALAVHRRANEIAPVDHPAMPSLCNSLGNAFAKHFEHSGQLEDLDQAISAHRRAFELMPEGHPERPLRLNNLGASLLARFEHSGKLEDLQQAISAHRRTVELTPDGHVDKPSRWNNLGSSFLARYERSGELDDLEQAISAHNRAVELAPGGHNGNPSAFNNLGNSLLTRFESSGKHEDLEHAIVAHRRALELTPENHPEKPARFSNLGISLSRRFERSGELEDIEQSIAMHRRAVNLLPDSHPDKPLSLNNLGNSLFWRFQRDGELEDMTGAVLVLRQSVELTPVGHPEKASRFNNLGNALLKRFEHSGDLEDLQETISSHRHAVELTADVKPEKPTRLSHLCADLRTRFELTNDHDDIVSAIAVGRHAVALLPKGHPKLTICYPTLALCLRTRFQHGNDIEDLNAAICMFRMAADLMPEGDPRMSLLLQDLGAAQVMCFNRTQTQTDFDAAIGSFMKSTLHPSGNPSTRLESARRCALILSEQPSFSTANSLLSAHSRIIAILPEIVWLGHGIHRRYEESSQLGRLVNGSVSVAIATGALTQAVEWLEAGRALIWSQVLSLRTPLDELQEHHPKLAATLRETVQQLQTTAHVSFAPDIVGFGGVAGLTVNSAADIHRGLAIKYDNIMKRIRACPGFEGFLRPKTLDSLIPPPELMSGPIVFVNVHRSRCDAVILHVSGVITTVPLPDLCLERASQLRSLWTEGLSAYRNRIRTFLSSQEALERDEDQVPGQIIDEAISYRHMARVIDNEESFARLFECMWKWIVDPILQSIDRTTPMHINSIPHITWCPTGPLTQLPIHAAGIYSDPPGPRAFDFVVSSYTPSLSAFLRCAEDLVKHCLDPSVLIVTQPETPGYSRLPETRVEGLRLQVVLKEARIANGVYDHEQATVKSIRAVMHQFPWVHLACHGSQRREDATKSAFELYDGPITLSDLMGTVAENAELAFLSACQTAVGDEKTPEESAHLAAGMLAVGFKGVVATTWSIRDADAPVIVEAYYKELLALRSTGGLRKGETGAAYALHKATRVLREQVGETNFMRWVPFVHFGV